MSHDSPPSSENTCRRSVVAIGLPPAVQAERKPLVELAATLYLPEPEAQTRTRAPGLIVGHGAGSRRERHAVFCLEACRHGFVVLALDFRGHGDSGGRADGPLEEDLCAAAQFVRAHPAVDPARLCYRGSSMGGFYGLKAARAAGFAAMALLCPASEQVLLQAIDEYDQHGGLHAPESDGTPVSKPAESPRWDIRRLRAYFEQQNSHDLAAQVDCPVLLIHAREDEVVPFAHSLALLERLPAETTLLALPGGTHTTAQHDPEVHRYSVAWLAAKLMH